MNYYTIRYIYVYDINLNIFTVPKILYLKYQYPLTSHIKQFILLKITILY